MFNQSTNTVSFVSILIALLRLFSRSPWRGLLRRRETPVWGSAHFRTTPRAATTRPPDSVRSLATPRAPKQPLYPDNRREKPLIVATRE
jgi:hypothetical protein